MKKYLLAAVCVLAVPLLAQAPAYEVEYPLPADIYEALWSLPALQQVEENAKQTGAELTEKKKKDLAKYTERVKGLVVVEITGEKCPPCLAFARMLKEDTFLDELRSKGGRFYQLDVGTEKGLSGKKLSTLSDFPFPRKSIRTHLKFSAYSGISSSNILEDAVLPCKKISVSPFPYSA